MKRRIYLWNVLGLSLLIFGTTQAALSATIYVGNQGSNSISVIDSLTRQVTKTVPLSTDKPHDLTLSADGHSLYVANVGSSNVLVLDLKSWEEVVAIPAGKKAHGITPTPDGRFRYFSIYRNLL